MESMGGMVSSFTFTMKNDDGLAAGMAFTF